MSKHPDGDALHFEFQAAGEFIGRLARRQAVEFNPGNRPVLGGKLITFNTAVAVLVDGDRVGVYVDEPAFLMVNGMPVGAADIAERLPHGGTLERHGSIVATHVA